MNVDLLLTRRGLLTSTMGLVGASALAACGSQDPGAPSPDRDESTGSIRVDVAIAEQRLIEQYDAAIGAFPELAAALATLKTQHQDHLGAMGDAAFSPSSTASSATNPADGRSAILELMDAERQAARARRTSCGATADPDLARTLAFIAASEASHVPALRTLLAT